MKQQCALYTRSTTQRCFKTKCTAHARIALWAQPGISEKKEKPNEFFKFQNWTAFRVKLYKMNFDVLFPGLSNILPKWEINVSLLKAREKISPPPFFFFTKITYVCLLKLDFKANVVLFRIKFFLLFLHCATNALRSTLVAQIFSRICQTRIKHETLNTYTLAWIHATVMEICNQQTQIVWSTEKYQNNCTSAKKKTYTVFIT